MKRGRKLLLAAVVVILALMAAAHWYFSNRGRFTTEPVTSGLAREVSGQDLVSTRDPALVLRFDPAFTYLGGQKFVLYGVADTEQYFFAETTADGSLESVYWIQYEAYLSGRGGRYDYDDSPLRVTLGDVELFTDTAFFHNDPDRKRKPGTDGQLAHSFLAGKGYGYPGEVVYARLVHLPDEDRRKELMIIFMDDLAAYGATAAELEEGGALAERWPEIERAHLDRIRQTLSVLPVE